MAINFLPQDERKKKRWLRIRRWVVGASSAVLVVNLVGVAGVVGWWWFQKQQEVRVTAEMDAVLREWKDFASAEALIRQIGARLDLVEQGLAVKKTAEIVEGVICPGIEITNWQNGPSGQTLTANSNGAASLEDCSRMWKLKYPDSQMVGASRLEGSGWTATWQLEGVKK